LLPTTDQPRVNLPINQASHRNLLPGDGIGITTGNKLAHEDHIPRCRTSAVLVLVEGYVDKLGDEAPPIALLVVVLDKGFQDIVRHKGNKEMTY